MSPLDADTTRPARSQMVKVLRGVLASLYPLAIWWALDRFGPRGAGVVMLVGLGFVAFAMRNSPRTFRAWGPILGLGVLVGLGVVFANEVLLRLSPVWINLGLLVIFGASLRKDQIPMIERFARMIEPDLSPQKREHCRKWTWFWCAFFVLNGGIATSTAIIGSRRFWAMYNGGIAYGLMALMFAAEWIERRLKFGPKARASSPTSPE